MEQRVLEGRDFEPSETEQIRRIEQSAHLVDVVYRQRLRRLCVEREGWLSAREFEDGIVASVGSAMAGATIIASWS